MGREVWRGREEEVGGGERGGKGRYNRTACCELPFLLYDVCTTQLIRTP